MPAGPCVGYVAARARWQIWGSCCILCSRLIPRGVPSTGPLGFDPRRGDPDATSRRCALAHSDLSTASDSPVEVADDIDQTALATVMRSVPLGAAVLAGSAVAILVVGYLLVYILVFLPRGTVG